MLKSLATAPLAAVVALALSAPAMAAGETDKSPSQTQTQAPAATPGQSSAPTSQTSAQIDADKLIGKDIKNAEGDTIGEVTSVILNPDGEVAAAIVGVGGFLGMGEREVAIDWNQLNVASEDEITVSMTEEQLKALPEYKYQDEQNRGKSFRDETYGTGGGTTAPGGATTPPSGGANPPSGGSTQ